ncbi:SepM family pheromone-processing serine protease [Effusibacillus pohliae]|uniref:SepM family pheromone-processing serine protease n=1 Tax=Effusibacillus pohliae TaxID=232270 RepID=UPI000378B4F6|nr:SepM family pheromone-processing serine protease [Effusibacillus pohliae]
MATRLTARSKVIRFLVPLLLILSWFIPLPYYIYQPGSAEELQSILTVAGGQKDEKGALMLTTVLTVPVENIYYYAYGKLLPNRQIVPKEEADRGLAEEDYKKLLRHMMNSSQESAVVAAMRYLGRPVTIRYMGALVSGIAPYSKAKNVLQIGDLIVKVDDRPVAKREDLVQYLHDKQVGDKVKLQLIRDSQPKTAEIELVLLRDLYGDPLQPSRAGLGIDLMDKQEAENLPKVDFHTDQIGGPSAGLMFALEIVSQLTPGDLTKGHKIAGTGTIDGDGNVGQIGGIEHKIVAADKKGAEIFFCPADVGPNDTNTKMAKTKAAEIGTKMTIVPVRTLADAVDYLNRLP